MNSNDEHKKTDEDQPWNQTFSEDRDENGNLSRVKLRKQSQNHHLITIVLAALILIVAIVALVYGLVRQSAMGNDSKSAESSSVRVVRQDTAKKKSSATPKSKSDSTKAKSTVKHRTDKAAKESQKAAVRQSSASSNTTAASSSTQSSATSQSSQAASSSTKRPASTAGHKYVTVQAGQGMFRVAYNNGLTTAQLMQMNGLTSSSQLYPGQRLRVK
ncbi:LysM domain-containing protein [Lentilactobacillus otakiensis]|uniref:LysM peptidoglycan-binding domain-containing protein n=1 Tax=Lentilactobacillus otakiensis TaxID=481720 RepID=UPI0006EFABBF|nr:LysM domain-containing protein [Lentilactobacillus otakiensis]KRL09152.1 peptidoglycan-binding lysin domain-containing protein [Lentilactobacillus otakiensis DSM 19908 = JCM 15040]MBZ3775769.1 LysM peptidoglycan-binding domain-containing protein [Lentilactobacillus otakiensis]MDV3518988.1 LysM domain-containing protein [Lentilactobacillus otakiensis]